MKKQLWLVSFLVALALIAACATPPTATPVPPTAAPKATEAPKATAAPTAVPAAKLERNIKVGIVDTYSGPPAAFGNDALNGWKLAVNEINQTGVLGAKIEFIQRDDKYAPDTALTLMKEVVLQEKVDVVVGTINSAAALPMSAYAKEQKLPYIVWIAKSEKITGKQGHRYVFSTGENTYMAGKAGAQGLAKKPYVKYWIAGEDYEYGHDIADSVWNNLKQIKPDVQKAGETWWKSGEPDLVPYMTQISAAKPDAVIFATGGAGMTNALKTAKATGLTDKIPTWFHTGIDLSVLKPLGAAGPEGVLGTMDYLFYYPESAGNTAFVKAFQAAYKDPPGFPAFHAYNTAYFIAKAFEKAGSLDKEKFIDALEGLKINAPTGELEMRACDHQVVLPMFFGVTKKVAQFPDFLVGADLTVVAGKDIMPTCDEIKKLRGQ